MKILKSLLWLTRIFFTNLFNRNCNISYFQSLSLSTKIEIRGKDAAIVLGKGINSRRNISFYIHGGKLEIGRNCFFNDNCHITVLKEVIIGKGCCFGPNVSIFDHDHNYKKNHKSGDFVTDQVFIGDNVWIGANCIVLKGTKIGDNSVIAAGTIIRGNIPANSLVYQKSELVLKQIISE